MSLHLPVGRGAGALRPISPVPRRRSIYFLVQPKEPLGATQEIIERAR
jgi:hypothetical protein